MAAGRAQELSLFAISGETKPALGRIRLYSDFQQLRQALRVTGVYVSFGELGYARKCQNVSESGAAHRFADYRAGR